jgi:hypothetical protein
MTWRVYYEYPLQLLGITTLIKAHQGIAIVGVYSASYPILRVGGACILVKSSSSGSNETLIRVFF